MTPSTTTPAAPPVILTADEFIDQFGHTNAELEAGIVKELPMPGLKHGKICLRIGSWILLYVDTHDLGHVMSNDAAVKTKSNPDTIRGADVCYYGYERLPKGVEVSTRYAEVPPDLVVEVRSPSDRFSDAYTKIGEYLNVGVRAVIYVDPDTTSATVYRAGELHQTFHNGDELTVPDVLPGFSMVVKQLFE